LFYLIIILFKIFCFFISQKERKIKIFIYDESNFGALLPPPPPVEGEEGEEKKEFKLSPLLIQGISFFTFL